MVAKYQELVEEIVEQTDKTNVEMIFGQSRQVGDKVIIPVAKISYGWGGGGSKGKMAALLRISKHLLLR